MASQVTFLESSQEWERCWFLLHTLDGPYLICCWYRPPGESLTGISAMQSELRRLRNQGVGVLIIGDMNVHNPRWLRFSNKNTPEGTLLYETVAEEGLEQIVKEPTRNE